MDKYFKYKNKYILLKQKGASSASEESESESDIDFTGITFEPNDKLFDYLIKLSSTPSAGSSTTVRISREAKVEIAIIIDCYKQMYPQAEQEYQNFLGNLSEKIKIPITNIQSYYTAFLASPQKDEFIASYSTKYTNCYGILEHFLKDEKINITLKK
jgi:hypothetical protein